MPSIRFRLDPAPLAEVEQEVKHRYGIAATVLSTEEVRVGGVGGFFARRYLDVVVELPDLNQPPEEWTARRRVPTDALVEQADLGDVLETPVDVSAVPPLSTESDMFTGVLADLQRYASPTPSPRQRAPRRARPVVLLKAPGDLVVIAGIGDDALTVARSLAGDRLATDILVGGAAPSQPGEYRISDHRTAFSARARGVEAGRSTIVAYAIEPGDARLASHAAALVSIRPDQLWLAVDASRKPDDTADWVTAVSAVVPVQAIAVLRTAWTSTPETVGELGLPEAWSDAVG